MGPKSIYYTITWTLWAMDAEGDATADSDSDRDRADAEQQDNMSGSDSADVKHHDNIRNILVPKPPTLFEELGGSSSPTTQL